MADLSQELPFEKLTGESWAADKAARGARVASRNPQNNSEKALFRQMGWCNTNMDHLGDIIREFKKIEVVATPDTAQVKHFNAGNKDAILQKLRAAAVSNNNNTAYLRLAKDFNYQAADEFEESNCEDSSLDETTAKKLEKIAKKHAGKTEKDREHPYKKKPQYQQYTSPQQQYTSPQQQHFMPAHHFTSAQQQYMPPLQQQYMPPLQQQLTPGVMNQFPPMQPGSQAMQGFHNMQQGSQAMQGVRPPMVPLFQPGSAGRGSGFNKTFSKCRVCKGLGHWGGDPECPYTISGAPALLGPQTAPPGTGTG